MRAANEPDEANALRPETEAKGRSTSPRYVEMYELGVGGMGRVVAAFDVELARKVALKILAPDTVAAQGATQISQANERLRREARALARLNHPNIVAIFDIVFQNGHQCLAMELVEGTTLHEWLRAGPHSIDERIEVVRQAGEGLRAAHHAGFVHRDFKPQNVIVDANRRAKVLDFGLVQDGDSATLNAGASQRAPGVQADPDATLAGTRMGTPRYMAPEQYQGRVTDARTDVFAFCITLHLALFGTHPFAAPDIDAAALEAKICSGQRLPISSSARKQVSRKLLDVLDRGLSVEPTQRWPSMDACLAAIDEDREQKVFRRQVRRASLVSAGIVLLTAIAWPTPLPTICDQKVATAESLWNNSRAEQVGAHVLASLPRDGALLWNYVEPRISDYLSTWSAAAQSTCELNSSKASINSNEEIRTCLDDHLQQSRVLIEILATGAAQAVAKVPDAFEKLGSPRRCVEERQDTSGPLPRDAASRETVIALRHEIANAQSLTEVGALDLAQPLASRIMQSSLQAGDLATISAAFFLRGTLESRLSNPQESERYLTRALLAGIASKNRKSAVTSAIWLIFIRGYILAQIEGGQDAAELAPSLMKSANSSLSVTADYNHLLGTMIASQEHPELGADYFALALEQARAYHGDRSPRIVAKLNDYAVNRLGLGQPDKALAALREALAIAENGPGRDSGQVALAHSNISSALAQMHRFREAAQAAEMATEICARSDGKDRLTCAVLQILAADALIQIGAYTRAEELAKLAQTSQNVANRRGRPWEPWAASILAKLALARGNVGEAINYAQEALARSIREVPQPEFEIKRNRLILAQAFLANQQAQQAIEELELADAISVRGESNGALDNHWPEFLRARWLALSNQDQEALTAFVSLLSALCREVSCESSGLSEIRLHLAKVATKLGRLDLAEHELMHARENLATQLGDRHHLLIPYLREEAKLAQTRGQRERAVDRLNFARSCVDARETPTDVAAALRDELERAQADAGAASPPPGNAPL
jgi:serine/threonine protein kinase